MHANTFAVGRHRNKDDHSRNRQTLIVSFPLSCEPFTLFMPDIRLSLALAAAVFILMTTPCLAQFPSPPPSPRPESSPQTQPPPTRLPTSVDSSDLSTEAPSVSDPQNQNPSGPLKPPTNTPLTPRLPNLQKPVIPATPLSVGSVQTHMGMLMPAGDLAQRFGAAGQVGLELGRVIRGKWLMGGSITHLFSNSVREQDISRILPPSRATSLRAMGCLRTTAYGCLAG